MTDYQHIANDVRDFIEGIAHTPDQATQALAQAYAAACNEVNARLRRCSDLLLRGLRAEALHAAQASPDLLDVVAILDVPEIVVWENACAMNDLTRPPRLLVEVAAELNEAYASQAPLQSTFDELRLLVLARAPLMDRLRVTRRLRSLEPSTPHWAQDVAELERATLDAARVDVAQIVRTDDGAAARRMVAELTSPEWQQLPPDELIEPLVAVGIRALAQDLAAAKASDDVRAGRRAMNGLNKLIARAETHVPAALTETMSDANAWLARAKDDEHARVEFDDLCKLLLREVRAGAAPANLRALHAQLRTFGRPIPTELEGAYQRSVGSTRWSSVMIGVTILVLLVVACVAVGLWWFKHRPLPYTVPHVG